jgi:hypothetical protein
VKRPVVDARLGRAVRFLRNSDGSGTVLDAGTVIGVTSSDRDRLTVRTADGAEHTIPDHPDFVLWD